MSLYQLQKLIYHVNRDATQREQLSPRSRRIRQELRIVRARVGGGAQRRCPRSLYDRRSFAASQAIYLAQQSFQRRLCQSTKRIGVIHADRFRLRRQPCPRNDRLDGSRTQRASRQFSWQLSKARRPARAALNPMSSSPSPSSTGRIFFSTRCPPSASAAPSTTTARSKNGCGFPKHECPATQNWRRN